MLDGETLTFAIPEGSGGRILNTVGRLSSLYLLGKKGIEGGAEG